MRRGLKWAGIGLGVVLLLAAGLLAVAWAHSERALARQYVVADPPLVVPADPDTLARGRHLYVSRGCTGCHGDAGEGKLLFDAGPVARVVPSNLTRTVRDRLAGTTLATGPASNSSFPSAASPWQPTQPRET